MEKANNADVEQALAVAGSRSLTYRTFAEASQSDTTEPRTSVSTAFPLLAVALPEIGDQLVTAAGRTIPGLQIPQVVNDPTGRGDPIAETIGPTAPMMTAPASEPVASMATAPLDAPTRARSPDTPLAAIFRLLRGQTRPSPTADRDSLEKLFRRL